MLLIEYYTFNQENIKSSDYISHLHPGGKLIHATGDTEKKYITLFYINLNIDDVY